MYIYVCMFKIYFELLFVLIFFFRVDGDECCIGYLLNKIMGNCESKDMN